jgi:hypothetical protein
MDPKSKWPTLSPAQQLQQLRWFRDENHKLRDVNVPGKLYDQDWFIGAVLDGNLEQAYMADIDKNHRA